MTSRAALSVETCTVVLGGRAIVREVDLHVEAGEVVALFGPSGAGKSTLFGAIAGELRTQRGRIVLGEDDVTGLPMWTRARRGLGYVPQGPSVLLDLTVAQNLTTFAALGGVSVDVVERSREVELHERLDVRAGALSGGERRRLELARALVSSPRVLLCDEPFAGLGPTSVRTIGELLRDRARRGVAVLLSDHHVGEALAVADRAYLLVDGAAVVEERAACFASNHVVTATYVGEPAGSPLGKEEGERL